MLASRLIAFGVAIAVPTSVMVAQPATPDQSGPYPRPAAKYEVRVDKDVMVSMRDGVRLATDLYIPMGVSEKLPVILVRLPYNKNRYGITRTATAAL